MYKAYRNTKKKYKQQKKATTKRGETNMPKEGVKWNIKIGPSMTF